VIRLHLDPVPRVHSTVGMRIADVALATGLATCVALVGCSKEDPTSFDPEDGVVVEDGKADNYISLIAKEYVVAGSARVVVEAGEGEARARELIVHKHMAITWFLNQYLVDKDASGGDHGDPNAAYGGFSAMVKDGAFEDLDLVQKNATTWEFSFTQIIAGRANLLRRLPLDAQKRFSIEIGKPTNEEMTGDPEWYRKDPWNAWNPVDVAQAKKETLTLQITEERKSTDAWWDYNRLLDDGVLTIDAHFGYDYNPERQHLTDSRSLYNWLLGRGFRSPVTSFDRLTRTSKALTKTITANGRQVRVDVKIHYPKAGGATDPDTDAGGKQLELDMLASLATKDVVVFSGHSGPLYGFALANWNKTAEGDLDDAELAVAPLATGKYQVVLAEGCNTYMLGHALLTNPSKQGKDIDIITTTNPSVSYSPVEDFLARLLELDSQARLRPRTLTNTIADLDLYTDGEAQPTMYGVHGVDDNPKVHPFAKLENACTACSSNAQCGGVGNACIAIGASGKRCAAACTDDSGCGAGYKCKDVASSSTSTIYGSYCVPETRSCN